MKNIYPFLIATLLTTACNEQQSSTRPVPATTPAKETATETTPPKAAPLRAASPAEIMERKQVPVLCYHHIVSRKPSNAYEVTIENFKDQMKTLADSGYNTVLPDQLYAYLNYGTPLPPNPVMITYDDTDLEQFTIAKPEMDQHGFKGVYFIMTISIGRPNYMTREQIKQLSDEGHYIASHTWDHSRFDRYKQENLKEIGGRKKTVNDYDLQLKTTRETLESITGKPVEHFAYPFGVWNAGGIPELQERGYKTAFQLAAKRDSLQPLHTIRRILVVPQWSAQQLLKVMKSSF